jgi:RHS repeat-associated protein
VTAGNVPCEGTEASTTLYYVHADHLNTPRALVDQQNRVVWRWDSDPFGVAAPAEDPDGDGKNVAFDLRFPGQYFDRETNLHYNYFRDYDPQTGRYVQSDPIGLAGGINPYAYVAGNPVSFADPFGLVGDSVGGSSGRPVGPILPDPTVQAQRELARALSRLIKNTIDVCFPSDCERIYTEIDRLVNQLARRERQLLENRGSLPMTGPNSVEGHREKFRNRQSELRDRLNEANTKGCKDYRRDAWDWATKPAPSPTL